MQRFLIPVILVVYSAVSLAGNAGQTALGNIGAISLGSAANYANPAGLVWNSHHAISTSIARHHLIPALDLMEFSYSGSRNTLACGLYYAQTGDVRLQIHDLSLSYAQLFSDKFSLALRPRICQLKFADSYGQKTVVMTDLGMMTRLNDKFDIGFYLLNVGRSKVVNKINERYDSAIITGLSYKTSELLTMLLEIEKHSRQSVNSKIGLEYRIVKSFILRGGFQSAYRRFSAGFGYRTSRYDFDSAVYYTHPTGYSLVFGITVSIENPN